MQTLILLLSTCSTIILYRDLPLLLEDESNPMLSISSSMGLSVDILLLFSYLSVLQSGAVERTHHLISGTRALLLVMFPYRVTLLVSPHVLGKQVVVGFALLATICLLKVLGLSLPRPPRSAVSQQQYWWRVLGSLRFFLIFADVLRCWWDAADVLKYVTRTCGIIVDMLLVFLYAASMHEGSFVGASLGGGVLVAVDLSYRTVALMTVPPLDLWVVSVFGVMIGTCVFFLWIL